VTTIAGIISSNHASPAFYRLVVGQIVRLDLPMIIREVII
jgi:hypothetical protein